MNKQYIIKTNSGSGHTVTDLGVVSAPWSPNFKPMVFNSIETAKSVLNDFITACPDDFNDLEIVEIK